MQNKHIFSRALLFVSIITAFQTASAHRDLSAPRATATDPRYVLTDIELLRELGVEPLMTHEATGTVLARLNAKEREELADHAHDRLRCGGHEVLNISEKSGILGAKSVALNAFGELDRQLRRDEVFETKLANKVGIGLPSEPRIRDAEIEKAILEVSEANLKTTVDFLAAFPSRNHKNGDGQRAVLAFKTEIEKTLKDAILPYQIDLITHSNTPMNSIRLTIPGATNPGEIVVAGGHLDSINQSFFGAKKAPGADDNASGSANLLEVARILTKGKALARTVEIYWYAGEEGGLLGSAEIAANAKSAGKKVVGVLQLDMTLFPGDGEFKLGSMTDFTSLEMRELLKTINTEYIGATIIEDKCGYGCSDHASWYKNGYPTLMPFEATKKRMNSAIHTDKDVVSTTSSFRHSAMFSKIAIAFLSTLAK